MSDAISGQLIVAGTALLSGAVGLVGGLLIEQLRTGRDRAARLEARQDAKDDFQRHTLLELQEAIANFARVVGKAHHHDWMANQATGQWGRTLFADEMDEEILSSQVRLQLLTERIRDDELRPLLTGFKNRGMLVTIARSERQATERMDDWMERMGSVQDRLGTVLRTFV